MKGLKVTSYLHTATAHRLLFVTYTIQCVVRSCKSQNTMTCYRGVPVPVHHLPTQTSGFSLAAAKGYNCSFSMHELACSVKKNHVIYTSATNCTFIDSWEE